MSFMIDYPLIIKDVLSVRDFIILNNEMYRGWNLTNYSNRNSSEERLSWGVCYDEKTNLFFFHVATIIKLKMQKHLQKNLKLIRIHTNGNLTNQTSSFHTDYCEDNVWTFILFTSTEWNTNWGGEFVVFHPELNEYRYVPYIPNTGCFIPSNWEHRGSCPNSLTDKLRTTMAFSFCDKSIFGDMKKYKSTHSFI